VRQVKEQLYCMDLNVTTEGGLVCLKNQIFRCLDAIYTAIWSKRYLA